MSRYTEYYKKHSQKCRLRTRNWVNKNPQLARIYRKNSQWKRQGIGMTWEQYLVMLERQHYKCAICEKSRSMQKWDFAVDHDHKTKEIRGLLCIMCNSVVVNAVENYSHLLDKTRIYLGR
jgi:hypothetical protein